MRSESSISIYLNKYIVLAFFFTFLNVISGVGGIIFSLNGNSVLGFQLLILGAIFDFLDGFLAKRAPKTTTMGFYADSFGDVITFALLPAYLVITAYQSMHYDITWFLPPTVVIAAFYAICGWFRLVRFAVKPSGNKFEGLPSPAAALLVGSSSILVILDKPKILSMIIDNGWLFSALIIITAILMVTTINYPSPKRKAKSDLILIGVAGLVVLSFVIFPNYLSVSLIMAISLLYTFVGPYYYKETEKLLHTRSTLSYKKGE